MVLDEFVALEVFLVRDFLDLKNIRKILINTH